MKEKIGILTCLNSNDVCTRAGCLSAFWEKTDFFCGYPKDTELAVLMTCGGCKEMQPKEPEEDPGMQEKLERLQKEQVTTIHVGVCRMKKDGTECERMIKICRIIENGGIRIVRGTHRE
ncbi:MAG: CGGC domain-containing protein [Fusicatenibacter sp.]|nr:CGGC domain-containing protein [Fusicatenibacter sp.]